MPRRRNPFGTRQRKVRPAITVKVKPAPRKAKCTACRMEIKKGEEATYVRVRVRRFHKACTPANIGAPPQATAPGAPAAMPRGEKEAQQFAMLALENAMGEKAKARNFPDDLDKAFQKYNKIKELALRPGTEGEGATAMRLALVEVIKAVF
jgi:hypothetical protein